MKRLTILCLLAFCIVSVSQAQKKYDQLSYPKLNEFNKPDIQTFTTDNGIKFFLIEDHELPLINMRVDVRTGGIQVSDAKTGLNSLTGTVMRTGGTKNYPPDSLNAFLEDKAANINTGVGFTRGYASLSVLKEDFGKVLPVFTNILENPAFPQEKIDLAKKQLSSAISRRNDETESLGFREYGRLIYGKNSVYGRNTEYTTLKNINRDDIVAFHKKNFVGNNMLVGVVGDFDAGKMKQQLKQAFGTIPAGKKTNFNFPAVKSLQASSINFINKPDVDQSLVLMGHVGGLRDNPDYPSLQVMNGVLSGGFSGRILQKIRTNLGLSYSPGGRYGVNSFYPGIFVVRVKTKSSTTAKVITLVKQEIERLRNEAITKKELQQAKDQILNSVVFHYDSYQKVLNHRLSNTYEGLPDHAFQDYIDGVKSTTIADVQNVAQKYLKPDKLQILVVGNKDEIGNQLQQFGDVNTIDISIPQPGADQEKKMVQGDAQKGQQLLSKMADAVIAPGTEVNTLTISGKVMLVASNQTLSTTMKIDFPGDIEQTVQTARGDLKMSYKDGKGMMSMAGQQRPLPASSPQVKSLKNTLNRSVVAIAMNADKMNPQSLGSEKIDGTTYNKVNVKVGDANIMLFLNPDTNLPDRMEFQQFSAQQGKQIKIVNKYSNWTSHSGVTFPYKQVSLVDGEKQAVATYTSHEVNK